MMMKKILLASLVFGLSSGSSALELNIKASEINYKILVLGKIEDTEIKADIQSRLREFKDLKVIKSRESCKNYVGNFNTSYYCFDSQKTEGNVFKYTLEERYGSQYHSSFDIVFSSTGNTEKISKTISNTLYGKIFKTHNGASVIQDKLAFVQRKNLKNGKKIFNLKVSDYKGNHQKTLLASAQPILSIAWSPDNSKLAYVSYEKVRSSVFIQDLETGARKRVSTFKGINAFPSWSPDGKKIAMSLSKDGSSDIFIYDLKKNNISKITSFKAEAAEPVWVSNEELVFTFDKTGIPYLYTLNLRTKKVKELSTKYLYTTSAKVSNKMDEIFAIYSKNGRSGILNIDLNTKKEKVLVEDFFAESPSVSSSDDVIIYSTKKKDQSILRAVDKKGNLVYEINSIGLDLKEPSYSN